jgi:hypothetical protein
LTACRLARNTAVSGGRQIARRATVAAAYAAQTTRNSNADRRPPTTGRDRTDWTLDEARAIHTLPFNDLLFQAQRVPAALRSNRVQISTLLSIKTGGCPEDCAYARRRALGPGSSATNSPSRTSSPTARERSAPARRGSAWAPRTGIRSRASSR